LAAVFIAVTTSSVASKAVVVTATRVDLHATKTRRHASGV